MADDDDSKRAIPAWQRSAQTQRPPAVSPLIEQDLKEVKIPTPAEPAAAAAAEELMSEHTIPLLQLQHMHTFLEDPAVKNAPMDKKRAFFESKGISKEQIDKVLKDQDPTINVNDFGVFQQANPPPPQTPPSPTRTVQSTGPPIITYPEFLVEAHKPPPLITPTRIVNTAYVVSGLAAVLYGASKYLVTPMADGLTAARHDFALHSQSKVDEMNERLTKLVSKVPEEVVKKDKTVDGEDPEDDGSETSDPTELYHRDMGTQTESVSSPTSSLSSSSPGAQGEKRDGTTYATNGLSIMKSHLDEMLQKSQSLDTSIGHAHDMQSSLRTYLDTLMYVGPSYGMWDSSEGAWSSGTGTDGKKDNAANEDMVEELKKEIRGVKGVLLSAKRFPGVVGKIGTT